MEEKNKKLNFIKEEERMDYIKKIISFFLDERNEEIGVIAAGKVFDSLMEEMGRDFYKKGIRNAKKLLKEKIEDLEVDLDLISDEFSQQETVPDVV
jgi:uncharacterized protein (DUF2164 family)